MVFCVKCGTELIGPFCARCGTKSAVVVQKKEPDFTDDDDGNTLNVVQTDGYVTKFKVEDGSIKVGYYDDNDWKWEATQYILVQYPNSANLGSMGIQISYEDKVNKTTWFIRNDFLSKMTGFINTLVSTGKLLPSVSRGTPGIIYFATAQDMIERSTNLRRGMGIFNPYLLHKTDPGGQSVRPPSRHGI